MDSGGTTAALDSMAEATVEFTGKIVGHDALNAVAVFAAGSWPLLAASLLLVLGVWIPRGIMLRLMVSKKGRADAHVKQWKRLSFLLASLLSLGLVVPLWVNGVQSLGTMLGLVTAGLAVTMAHPLQSVLAGLYLMARRPYQIGDRIQIGQHTGDVVDIRLLSTILLELEPSNAVLQRTGRMIHVQNRLVFDVPLLNSSQTSGMLWDELSTTLTFESDWHAGSQIVHRLIRETLPVQGPEAKARRKKAEAEFDIVLEESEPSLFVDIMESGVQLTARYLVPVEEVRNVRNRMARRLLSEVSQCSTVEFAYPTSRALVEVEGGTGRGPSIPQASDRRLRRALRDRSVASQAGQGRHPLDQMELMFDISHMREGESRAPARTSPYPTGTQEEAGA